MGNNMQSRKEVIQMQWREIYVLRPRDNLSNEEEYVITQGKDIVVGKAISDTKQYRGNFILQRRAGFIIARTEH